MTHQNTQLIERWFAIQTSHDLSDVPNIFAEDVVYEDAALGLVKHGPKGITELLQSMYRSFPDYAVTMTSAVADDIRGGAEMIMSGTNEKEIFGMPGTGKLFSIRAAAAMRFADGRINHWVDYWLVATFKEQVGID